VQRVRWGAKSQSSGASFCPCCACPSCCHHYRTLSILASFEPIFSYGSPNVAPFMPPSYGHCMLNITPYLFQRSDTLCDDHFVMVMIGGVSLIYGCVPFYASVTDTTDRNWPASRHVGRPRSFGVFCSKSTCATYIIVVAAARCRRRPGALLQRSASLVLQLHDNTRVYQTFQSPDGPQA